MFDEKTGHLKLDKSLWTPVFAFTFSPRDSYDKSGLEKDVNDFWRDAGILFRVHLAPHTWGSLAPDSCGYSARTHLHGTMFQLVSEVNEGNRIRVSQIRYLAKVKGGRLFRGDNLNETFKSITSLEGWHSYTNAGHRPIGSFVYCPQVRSGCKPKKNRKGVLACSVKRKMLID